MGNWRLSAVIIGFGILLIPGIAYAGWVSPTGSNNPTKWRYEANAYDDNESSYALNEPPGANKWGQFLELTLSSPIYCDRVRVKSDFGYDSVDLIDIDIYANGTWIDKYVGTITDCVWTVIEFAGENNVTKARFRYHYLSAELWFWLYEFDFWEAKLLTPPTCQTNLATSVEETTAILHGEVLTDGGEPCEVRFQYGLTDSYGSNTSWESGKEGGNTFSKVITDLTVGNTYHFRAQVRNSAGTGSGLDNTFHTGAPSSGWISPTGYNDSDNKWEDETNAYDDNFVSYARCLHNINEQLWSPWLILTHGTMTSDKIRFYARGGGYIDNVDIDVFKDGVWTDVYQGTFNDKVWIEKNFTQGTVTQARIRFSVNSTDVGLYWELYEFDFYRISLNPPILTWTGETNYESDGLHPEMGYSSTNFVYRIEYTDADNDGPGWLKVRVDKNGDGDYVDAGEEISLSGATDCLPSKRDGNYANGEIFTTTINIPYGTNTDNCSYYFEANDGIYGTSTVAFNAPDIRPPLITSISPRSGSAGTLVTVEGEYFSPNSLLRIDFGTHPTITATTTSSKGTFSITFTVDTQPGGTTTITATDQLGVYDVDYFVITPAVSNIKPNSGTNTGTISTTITGSGFISGATATLTRNFPNFK